MIFQNLLLVTVYCLGFCLSELSDCTTPNSEEGKCISLFSCKVLQEALGSGNETAKKFVEASKCGEDFKVCCGSVGNYINLASRIKETQSESPVEVASKTKESRRKYVLEKFLPMSRYCGYQHSDDHYHEGNDTGVDEFPWLVHIDYQMHGAHPDPSLEYKCAAVLISDQLVLTSHNCGGRYLLNVKVGQYNKHNISSCVNSSIYDPECTDPVKESFAGRQSVGSLMLMRLTNKLRFSDYVRPICLPFNESQRPGIGATVYTSGWGEKNSYTGKTVHVKKRLTHRIKSMESEEGLLKFTFGDDINSGSVCEGDEGGPVMYSYKRHQWFLAGLIATTPCNSSISAEAIAITNTTIEDLIDPIFNFIRYL